jgi:hypothetical protein
MLLPSVSAKNARFDLIDLYSSTSSIIRTLEIMAKVPRIDGITNILVAEKFGLRYK